MNIKEAKQELVNTVRAYTRKREDGSYVIPLERQRAAWHWEDSDSGAGRGRMRGRSGGVYDDAPYETERNWPAADFS